MAKNTKFDCIENYVKKTAGTKFYEHADSVVMWKDNIKNYWQFFKDNQWTKLVNNLIMERGNWECDGADGFIIISKMGKTWKTSDPNWKDTPEQTTEGNPIFNCVKNYYADFESKLRSDLKNKTKYEYFQDYMSIISPDGSGDKENFFTDGKYEYFIKGKLSQEGKWFCKGERDYDVDDSKPSPEANDSFPLKLRSKGPNVVKLQKFLNDKIPGNPLTVNGEFDQKTADKLIEFQKKEGIIK
jgi:hypothetical protein